MRTKTLLIAAAAALAAGVISSQAQVYSQNIVGYVNATLPNGILSLQAPPFDAAGGNYLTNLISNPAPGGPGSGPLDGSPVYIWTGTAYSTVYLDSTYGGVANSGDSGPAASCPIITPGTSFFVNNQSGGLYTNTYVGTVHIDSGSYPGSSTNLIPAKAQLDLVASVLPIGGGLTSVLGLTNYDASGFGSGNGVLNGTPIYIPQYNGAGAFTGYSTIYIDDTDFGTTVTGYANSGDSGSIAEPVIPVGTGFFINNQSDAPIVWIQNIGQ